MDRGQEGVLLIRGGQESLILWWRNIHHYIGRILEGPSIANM